MLGLPAHRDFPAATVLSLIETAQAAEAFGVELMPCIVSDCSLGAFAARNLVAHEFLKSDCSHIFWLDSDMSWSGDDFIKLLTLNYPFVAAAGPTKQDKPRLAIYGDCVGLCFACVHRGVMEHLAAIKPKATTNGRKEVSQIFHCGIVDGKLVGEDILFCQDVKSLGYIINIDNSVNLGHIGTKEYRI